MKFQAAGHELRAVVGDGGEGVIEIGRHGGRNCGGGPGLCLRRHQRGKEKPSGQDSRGMRPQTAECRDLMSRAREAGRVLHKCEVSMKACGKRAVGREGSVYHPQAKFAEADGEIDDKGEIQEILNLERLVVFMRGT